METKFYTAALIGTGRIGFSLGFDKKREQPASHTMALLENKRIRLVAAADTDEEKLAEWKKYVDRHSKTGTQVFSSSDELYKNVNPDIITIAVNFIQDYVFTAKSLKRTVRTVFCMTEHI